jgi:hypothetical protein
MNRVTSGEICFSSSSHFPPMLYSKFIKPVALPPGRAKLSTWPALTGSLTTTNTIGTVRVGCCAAPNAKNDLRRERGEYEAVQPQPAELVGDCEGAC